MARKKRSRNRRRRPAAALRVESLEARRLLAASALHNAVFPPDVTADQMVTPRDVLAVILDMGRVDGSSLVEGESSQADDRFPDVNDDGRVSPLDALHVVEFFNQPNGTPVNRLDLPLSGDSGAQGKIEFELEKEDMRARREFKLELEDAAPDATYDVTVDGVIVGQITTDARGYGKLRYADVPKRGELPFPTDFPTVTSRTVVEVAGLSTTLGASPAPGGEGTDDSSSGRTSFDDSPHADDNSSRTGDDDSPHADDDSSYGDDSHHSDDDSPHADDDSSRTGDDSPHADDSSDDSSTSSAGSTVLFGQLSGAGTGHGSVKYEVGQEHGAIDREFEVELEHAAAGTTYDVTVDGVVVGQITTNAMGYGKLKYDDTPKAGEQPFPADFPAITDGTVVEVAGLSTMLEASAAPVGEGSDDSTRVDDSPHADDDSHYDDDSHHSDDDDSPHADDDSHRGDDSHHSDDDSPHADDDSHHGDDSPHSDDSHDDSSASSSRASFVPSHEVELKGRYRKGKFRGEVEFEVEREHGGWEVKFEVEVRGSKRGRHDVFVDGVHVGVVTIGDRGRGKLELSTMPDRDDLPMPADFPAIETGSVVEVAGLFTVTLYPDD